MMTFAHKRTKTLQLLLLGLLLLCSLSTNSTAQTPQATAQASSHSPVRAMKLKVLVLNYDPFVNGKRLHEELRFNDPRKLAQGYIADLKQVTKGIVDFEIVEWRDLDEIYAREDGGIYKVDDYVRMRRANSGWPESIVADYPRLLREQAVVPKINDGSIDEVWIFGDHFFGLWEASMAGPNAFFINGGVYPRVPSVRPFAFYGFNYERGVAEMLHNTAHRVEATMNRTYGEWNLRQPTNNWERFSANADQSNGVAGVGTCHWPANAQHDYDYSNRREVMSYADDFLNYPNLTLNKKAVSAKSWSKDGLDTHRDYLKWYFARIPKVAGVNPDGKLNNWLPYIFDFQNFDGQGRPLPNRCTIADVQIKSDAMTITVGLSSCAMVDARKISANSAVLVIDGKPIAPTRTVNASDQVKSYAATTYVFTGLPDLQNKSLIFGTKYNSLLAEDGTSFPIHKWKLSLIEGIWNALPVPSGRTTQPSTAKWILEAGGRVSWTRHADWIDNASELPTGVDIEVDRANLWNEGKAQFQTWTKSDTDSLCIFKNLTTLVLRKLPVGDEGCAILSSMHQLRSLNLHDCYITDVGLQKLETLTELEELDLGYSEGRISDLGARTLLKMPKLSRLNLFASSITDSTIRDVLTKLPQLRWVEVKGTQVTADGIADLRRANPDVEIAQ